MGAGRESKSVSEDKGERAVGGREGRGAVESAMEVEGHRPTQPRARPIRSGSKWSW